MSNASVTRLRAPLARGATILEGARSIVVFTGAGMSAESGIPTYRSGDDALWSSQHFDNYANPAGYRENLPASYEWYRGRALAVATAQPNAGHLAVTRLASLVPKLTVVTQNVDGLHVRAGSTGVLELHGNLRDARCDRCDQHVTWDQAPRAPVCTKCGGMLRPCVVMFEETLEARVINAARDAAERCDLLVSVGTSNLVWPARELPLVARDAGAWVFIVNTDLWGQPSGERVLHFEGRAGEVLPALVGALRPSR